MSADLLQLENFIAGQFTAPLGGRYLDSVDPSTGSAWARLPDSGADDVDAAVNSALNAFPSWSAKSAVARSQILDAIANQIEQHLDELAELESRDQGKPVWLARAVDIPRAVHNFRFFASANLHHLETLKSHLMLMCENEALLNRVCGLISPWNLPLYLLTFKLAPCLAAGNTAVCKPSELTSVTAWRLCQLMTDAGLPAGVVNMVFGRGATAGEALVLHPNVPAVSFTGSTLIGSRIQALTAPMVKKLSSFTNQGEICLCTSRIFVERSVYNEFLRQFLEETAKWKVCDRRDPATKLGAVVSAEHRQKILSYIESAPASGGRILCGQTLTDAAKLPPELASGFFVLPTVIVGAETDSDGGLSDEAPCMRDEIFGPVTCIVPFDDEA
uniref:Aldedh domain-containing protein n=1 Tax=Macrostomum lignano TaxID=282301 RepID=A0A1I8J859_9PLAT